MAGNVVSITLSMTCPDATTAQAWKTAIQNAYAAQFPAQGNDASGNPDPAGTINRVLVKHIEDALTAYEVAKAIAPLVAQRDSAINAAANQARANIAAATPVAVVTVQ